MLFSFQLYKLLHLLGLSMLLGGVMTSLLITRRGKGDAKADQGAFVASHLVAAPGLLLVLLTGIGQSFLYQWVQFKGTGYMHAKILFVVLIIFFLAMDIRAQGNMRRSLLQNSSPNEALIKSALATRTLAGSLNLCCLLVIFVLIVFKPF